MQRFRIDGWLSKEAPFAAEVSYPSERTSNTPEIKAYAMALIQALLVYLLRFVRIDRAGDSGRSDFITKGLVLLAADSFVTR